MTNKFRQAKLSDINDIVTIENECFPNGIRESYEEYINRIKIFPQGNMVYTVRNVCVACICCEIWQTEEINDELFMVNDSLKELHTKAGNTLFITTNALLKTYRNKGLGKKIFKDFITRMIKKFPNINKQLLVVAQPWTVAQAIYKKEGFKFVSLLQNYFELNPRKSFDGIVMKK